MEGDLMSFAMDEEKEKKGEIITTKVEKKKKHINKDLIKTMAVLASKIKSSVLGNIKCYFISLYYYHNYATKFEYNPKIKPVYLFNKEITQNNADEIKDILNTFLYMTYRTNFTNLKTIGLGNYTTDCGWGCMIRCSQMLLSKAFIEKKIFDLKQKESKKIDNRTINKIRDEVLCLFNDNYLSVEETRNHPDYKLFWEYYDEIAKESPEYKSIAKIIPPYSIHILSKLGYCDGKFTSDMNMINCFININSDLFDEINIISFCVGIINTKKLFKEFCEPLTDNTNNNDIVNYNGNEYAFKKGGIIFVSFRFGSDLLDKNYYKVIPFFFSKFRNNLGIIGGNRRRGYYFVGMQGNDNLILADPHFSQKTEKNPEKYAETYRTDNFYLLNIKEMRCQFSLCVNAFNAQQLNEFLEDAKWFEQNFKKVIKFE
jgi:hypothetical protein